MIAYKIEHQSTKTIYLTSDLLDVFDTIGKVSDGTPVLITTKELTVAEFENEVKIIAVTNQTITKL
ncbi:MAG: hypothetical protein WCJ61_16385 [Paludibacter sp.]